MPIMQVKVNGVWAEIPALVGPKGPQGPKGDPGQGLTDAQIDLLEAVLNLVTFSDAAAGQTAVANLMASLRGETPDVPTETYTNLVPTSIDSTGAIYNGVGYKNYVRVGSGGTESTSGAENTTMTGFIKVTGGDVVRIKNSKFSIANNANAIGVYGKNGNLPGSHLGTSSGGGTAGGIFSSTYSTYGWSSVVQETTGVWKWVVPPVAAGVEYIRLSCYGGNSAPGASLIVTVNQEITV